MSTVPSPALPHGRLPRLPQPLLLILAALLVGAAAVVTALLAHEWDHRWNAEHVVRGSGTAVSETRVVPPFTAVEASGSGDVWVIVGGTQRVAVRSDHNLVDRVTTEVRDGTLVVGTRGSFTTVTPLSVAVTVPALDAVELSGSGLVVVESVTGERLAVRVPGNGVVTASGTVERLEVDLGGSGDVRLGELVARRAVVSLSGSGRVRVHATSSLQARLSGSGLISYGGDPSSVTQSVSGSGAILPG